MATVTQHLEKARKELLDLSNRNRLLSIPKSGKSTRVIQVIDADTNRIFETLVADEKEMYFKPGKNGSIDSSTSTAEGDIGLEQELEDAGDDDEDSKITSNGRGKNALKTALTRESLKKRLLALQNDARTTLEEQGINILYLAVGQLKWLESDSSETERFAPLLLIPVELVRANARDRMKIKKSAEDLQENLSLTHKLNSEFGIIMPQFGDVDDFDYPKYCAAIRRVIKGQRGWEVQPDSVTLGFFSFAKFMMFKDLDPANWPEGRKIDTHALVTSLLCDGFLSDQPLFGDDAHLDECIPANRLDHVVDADGSQTLAIEHVRQGRNLVIQGPPGTGKSQTICNLISAAVIDGKRVLFVAEKLAALEVVKRRLEAAGLGALCLELHSNKANKRTVIEEIGKTWELGRPISEDLAPAFARLERLRTKLNLHCSVLHKPYLDSGLTPFRIIGSLVKLKNEGSQYPPIELHNTESWTKEHTNEIRLILNELVERIKIIGSPEWNTWRGTQRKNFLPIDADTLISQIRRLRQALEDLLDAQGKLSPAILQQGPTNPQETGLLLTKANHLAKAPSLDFKAICDSIWNGETSWLHRLLGEGRKFDAIAKKHEGKIKAAIWEKDSVSHREYIAKHGNTIWRFISWLAPEYHAAVADLNSVLTSPISGKYEDKLSFLDDMIEGQKLFRLIRSQSQSGKLAFGSIWSDEHSDWAHLGTIVAWVDDNNSVGLMKDFRALIAHISDKALIAKLAARVRENYTEFEHLYAGVLEALDLSVQTAFDVPEPKLVPYADLTSRIDEWISSIEGLSEWVAYHSRTEELRAKGVSPLIDGLTSGVVGEDELISVFNWNYYSDLLRQIVSQNPAIGTFDGLMHEKNIDKFRAADHDRLELSKLRTLIAHYEKFPAKGSGIGVTGIIKGEMARKRGHMPIRKLLAETGDAIQGIKPVFMMSPLSVAQFLEPGQIEFDLLVIDEASQVEPVDALGAVARAKQIVVVGDSKQLPPSKFFARMTSESSDDEDEDEVIAAARDIESILGLCLARGISQKMLRWHYRSRHHSLIAVSNHEFYDNRLFIVPSPFPSSKELGVTFHYAPDGIFDTGKTRVNRLEAQNVAKAVLAHAGDNPKLTLGVVAFSVSQRDAILDEIELLRSQNTETEGYFAAHPNEPFFVKNLENVQGDERDVIFISIGYARDPSGNLAMNFGPLSNDGGERRLNVLISRSKQRCQIFSSIRADDIDLLRAKGRGVATLKTFLRYAETGILGISTVSGKEEDSPFEEAVRSELEKHGLELDPQVGEAGFYIDLAVRDPERKGAYLLGIECDGATYHSSRSARDRDRLRQSVLEDHGWLIHRIWSTDWFQRPERELRRVLLAIELARNRAQRNGASSTVIPPSREISPTPTTINRHVDEKIEVRATPYMVSRVVVPTYNELHTQSVGQIARYVEKIMEVEAPIHIDEIVLRLRDAWGYDRAGDRIHALVSKAARYVVAYKRYRLEEHFYINLDKPIVPRLRDDSCPPSLRKPDNIPPQEIRSAIIQSVELHFGATEEDIAVVVARLFGFEKTGTQIKTIIAAQIAKLLRGGILIKSEGLIQRVGSANPSTPIRRK